LPPVPHVPACLGRDWRCRCFPRGKTLQTALVHATVEPPRPSPRRWSGASRGLPCGVSHRLPPVSVAGQRGRLAQRGVANAAWPPFSSGLRRDGPTGEKARKAVAGLSRCLARLKGPLRRTASTVAAAAAATTRRRFSRQKQLAPCTSESILGGQRGFGGTKKSRLGSRLWAYSQYTSNWYWYIDAKGNSSAMRHRILCTLRTSAIFSNMRHSTHAASLQSHTQDKREQL